MDFRFDSDLQNLCTDPLYFFFAKYSNQFKNYPMIIFRFAFEFSIC